MKDPANPGWDANNQSIVTDQFEESETKSVIQPRVGLNLYLYLSYESEVFMNNVEGSYNGISGIRAEGGKVVVSKGVVLCQGLISATHVSMRMVANVSLSISKQGRV